MKLRILTTLSILIILTTRLGTVGSASASSACSSIETQIKALEAERANYQKELHSAGPGEKPMLLQKIKQLTTQITQKQNDLDQCYASTPVLDQCSPPPDSYYKFPFGEEAGWEVSKGNAGDPGGGHEDLQVFAFDFVRRVNGVEKEGQKILAARPGTVEEIEEKQTGNSFGITKVFLFKGNEYIRVDLSAATYGTVAAGFPKKIGANWKGWPQSWNSGVDAAVNWDNGKMFFFKGNEFLRYDFSSDKVDAGFPKPIAGNWPGWPASWNSGIDDAINWGNGKVFFFKGGNYLRFDLDANQTDAGFPQSIASGTWKNLPAGWSSNIDAVLPWNFGRTLLAKGAQIVTIDMARHKAMNTPAPFSSLIANWPAGWSKVDAAVVWSKDGYLGVGNYIVVDQGDGTHATYWHLQRNGVKVKVGDKVLRGDWIGVSGNTGNSTTPHCHFDVRKGWDNGYPASRKEFQSVKIRFQDYMHTCWIPKVGNTLRSNNQ